MSSGDPFSIESLREALSVARGPSALIAVLWTWLAGQRQALGALAVTCHQIRDQVRRSTQIEGRTLEQSTRDEIQCLLMELPGLELEEAVAAAARTLATLGRSAELTRVPTWMSGLAPVGGVGGGEYLVFLRTGWAANGAGPLGDAPPEARENPALPALTPALQVVPVEVEGFGVRPCPRAFVAAAGPAAREWDRWDWRWQRRRAELADEDGDPRLRALVASLGTWSGPEWHDSTHNADVSPGNVIAAPGDARRETDGVGRVRDAVKAAVVARADLMVIPELSLSPRMLTALQDFLADSAGRGPIGTVAGLMHHVPTDDEAAGALQSRFVNEAVVLGPTGVELHRHRKLSAATFQNRSEDIRPGRSIFVLDTPAGGLAVVICLDLFAQKSKARIHQLPAQLLLVPSLSPGVSAHRSAASEAAHALWGLVLVCNRWFADDRGDAYSGSSRRSFAARAFTGCESLRLGASPISPSDGLFYYPHSE